jgi:hypothetical protein
MYHLCKLYNLGVLEGRNSEWVPISYPVRPNSIERVEAQSLTIGNVRVNVIDSMHDYD